MKKGEYVYSKIKQQLEVKNRTWQAVTYKNCFVAQEAITWMAKKDFLPLEGMSFGELRRKLRRRTTDEDQNMITTTSADNNGTTSASAPSSPQMSPNNNSNNTNNISDEKRRLAVEYADKLRRFGYFTHVVDESKAFADGFLYFRFTKITEGEFLPSCFLLLAVFLLNCSRQRQQKKGGSLRRN